MSKKIKVGFVSLGCSKNRIDTEVMLHTLATAGYEITGDETEADVVRINTCAFIESAKGRNDVEITDLVAQWVSENKISSKSCRRGLWRLLHAYKLYNGTESNFNTAMRNKQ